MKLTVATLLLASAAVPAIASDDVAKSENTNTGYAVFDLKYSNFDLSDGNNTSYSAKSVAVPNGQARFRYGDFIGEVQGTLTGTTRASDVNAPRSYGSTSFGMFGHYVREQGPVEIGFSGGVIGGSANETDTSVYGVLGSAVAGENWSVGIGHMGYVSGTEASGDGRAMGMTYLHGHYSMALSERTELFANGHIARGKDADESRIEGRDDDEVTSYNVALGVSHGLNDQVSFDGSVGWFGMDRQTARPETLDAMSINVGVKIALGGSKKAAKSAIRFDTPDLHREATWFDDF